MANFNWTFVNVDGVVNVSAISASSYISASTIYATTITASNFVTVNKLSIDVSGSTSFGDSNDDTHIRTGSLSVYRTADTATLPAELLKLEIGDEGVDMNIGSGPGIDFFVGETGGSDYAGTIAVIREQASDANTDSAMVFHTTTDDQVKANDREKMRITSAGKVGIGTTNPTKTLTVVGEVSASATITGSAFETATTVIDSTHVSSSLNISGSAFYGDGSTLSGISAGAIATYNTSGDNRIITSVDSNTVQGEASLTFDGSDLSVVSSTANRPRFFITNENADENPSQIIFNKTSSSPAENDTIGRMVFQSYDSAGNPTVYGQIEGDIKKPNSGAERGRIKLTVAEFDGTLTEGLTIQGSNADGKVDISVPNGSLSLTDNNKLYFGNAFDAWIEYDEAVSDKLIISGAHGGVYVSGSGGLTVAVNDGLTVTSATDDNPTITVENNSDGVGGGQLNFVRTTTDEAANDIIGSVNFMAKDSAGNDHIYAAIQGLIDDPTSGGEEGRLIFKVAEFDGNQQEGLRVEGQAVNGIVNVLVSNGSLQIKDLGTAGTTPASGFGGLYVNGDNLYFVNDSGTSAQLNAGGGASTAYNSFTANYTVTTDHDIMGIVTTGSAITASLASAATYAAGQKFIFKDVSGSCSGSNHIVISASQNHVGQNIDGQGILKIQSGYGSITLASDGVASFYIIGTN